MSSLGTSWKCETDSVFVLWLKEIHSVIPASEGLISSTPFGGNRDKRLIEVANLPLS